MHVILHVGAHRTASSAIRSHLVAQADALAAAHCAVWGPAVTRGGLFHRMSGGFDTRMPWEKSRATKRVALRALKTERDGVEQLIVSDADMLGSLRACVEGTRIYPDAGARLGRIAAGFAGHRLTVGLGIRGYADWWTSALAARLVKGGMLPKRAARECMVTQPRRWRHLVEEIAHALPDARIAVWTYEALGADPAPILVDLAEIATQATALPPSHRRPADAVLGAYLDAIGATSADYLSPDGRFAPFTPEETRAFDAQYAEDLAWLAAGAGGFADFIDAPPAQTGAPTDDGRGSFDDRQHRHLGRTGEKGTARPVA